MLSLLAVATLELQVPIGFTRSAVPSHFKILVHDIDTLQHTESDGTVPQILMLEAREICGGATGRNGTDCLTLKPTSGVY